MSDIAKLTVALYANSAQFVSELEKSQKKAKTWSDKVGSTFNVAAKATAAAAAATAGAMAAMYAQQSQIIDQTAKAADALGMTTEAYSQLAYAADLTGASQAFGAAMENMTVNLADAVHGSGEAVDALKMLGLSATELSKMTPDTQLLALADAMKQVENQSQKTFLTDQIFGGPEMMVMLNQGATGIRAMAEEADLLGVTLSRVDAAKIEMANDAMHKVSVSMQGWSKSAAVELAPLLAAIADEITYATKAAGGFGVVTSEALDGVVKGVAFASDVWRGWELIIKAGETAVYGYKLAMMTMWQSVIDGAVQAGETITKSVVWPMQSALDALSPYSDQAADLAESLKDITTFQAPQLFNIPDAKIDYAESLWELRSLASEPLPSDGIESWYQEAKKRIQETAELYASSLNRNSVNTVAPSIDTDAGQSQAVSSFQEATAKIQQEYIRRLAITASGEQAIATQEVFAYQDRQAQLSQQFQEAYEAAVGNNQLMQELEDQYFASRETLWQDHQGRLTEIELAEQKKRRDFQSKTAADLLTFTQQQMQITMGVLQDAGQESSMVYKMLFAMQKAAAIPSMIVATEEAAIKAMAAFPGPAGLTMAGAVRALGYASVGMVGAQAVMGMAHDGIDTVPREGTWLLDRGERVYTNQSAQKIDSMYNRVMGGESGSQGEAKQPWSIIVHEAPAGTTAEVDDEKRVIAIMMKDANSGGQYISYIQQKLGVRPGGYK
ncbi:hypothetical protein [Vibrio parahaemolyticus]|uniref:hypothetical protein n=1 Tax=Vibrio parahaemolyticus TaxID=670 RepID=UPI0015F65E86|nr:hypothetical protein [Vibrio parahaemolyticus]MBA5907931.1 hypothetical protein [Vibrio parahaemolyticus]